jgi:hypothetical protein
VEARSATVRPEVAPGSRLPPYRGRGGQRAPGRVRDRERAPPHWGAGSLRWRAGPPGREAAGEDGHRGGKPAARSQAVPRIPARREERDEE